MTINSDAAAVRDSRVDRVTEVYNKLHDLIVRGQIGPGARVIEAEVADRLGVSRTPVRSALHRLQQEGYVVEMEGGRRARLMIAPLTRDDASELFHLVAEIEGLAGWYAAQLDPASRGSLVARLRAVNADLSKAADTERPDQNTIFDLDDSFHRQYVAVPDRPRVRALHAAIKPQAERYIRVYISSLVDEIETSVEEHDRIIREIESGSADETQRSIQTNWRNALLRLGPVIDSVGERGSW